MSKREKDMENWLLKEKKAKKPETEESKEEPEEEEDKDSKGSEKAKGWIYGQRGEQLRERLRSIQEKRAEAEMEEEQQLREQEEEENEERQLDTLKDVKEELALQNKESTEELKQKLEKMEKELTTVDIVGSRLYVPEPTPTRKKQENIIKELLNKFKEHGVGGEKGMSVAEFRLLVKEGVIFRKGTPLDEMEKKLTEKRNRIDIEEYMRKERAEINALAKKHLKRNKELIKQDFESKKKLLKEMVEKAKKELGAKTE